MLTGDVGGGNLELAALPLGGAELFGALAGDDPQTGDRFAGGFGGGLGRVDCLLQLGLPRLALGGLGGEGVGLGAVGGAFGVGVFQLLVHLFGLGGQLGPLLLQRADLTREPVEPAGEFDLHAVGVEDRLLQLAGDLFEVGRLLAERGEGGGVGADDGVQLGELVLQGRQLAAAADEPATRGRRHGAGDHAALGVEQLAVFGNKAVARGQARPQHHGGVQVADHQGAAQEAPGHGAEPRGVAHQVDHARHLRGERGHRGDVGQRRLVEGEEAHAAAERRAGSRAGVAAAQVSEAVDHQRLLMIAQRRFDHGGAVHVAVDQLGDQAADELKLAVVAGPGEHGLDRVRHAFEAVFHLLQHVAAAVELGPAFAVFGQAFAELTLLVTEAAGQGLLLGEFGGLGVDERDRFGQLTAGGVALGQHGLELLGQLGFAVAQAFLRAQQRLFEGVDRGDLVLQLVRPPQHLGQAAFLVVQTRAFLVELVLQAGVLGLGFVEPLLALGLLGFEGGQRLGVIGGLGGQLVAAAAQAVEASLVAFDLAGDVGEGGLRVGLSLLRLATHALLLVAGAVQLCGALGDGGVLGLGFDHRGFVLVERALRGDAVGLGLLEGLGDLFELGAQPVVFGQAVGQLQVFELGAVFLERAGPGGLHLDAA